MNETFKGLINLSDLEYAAREQENIMKHKVTRDSYVARLKGESKESKEEREQRLLIEIQALRSSIPGMQEQLILSEISKTLEKIIEKLDEINDNLRIICQTTTKS